MTDSSRPAHRTKWRHLEEVLAIADDLQPEEHPEFGVMITAIHQVVDAIERVTVVIDAN
jgi:hypothetical protein